MIKKMLLQKNSGLNLRFFIYFLLFAYVPLLIFSVVGYFLNKQILRQIYLNDQQQYLITWEKNFNKIVEVEKGVYTILLNNLDDHEKIFTLKHSGSAIVSKPLALSENGKIIVPRELDDQSVKKVYNLIHSESSLYFNQDDATFWLKIDLESERILIIKYPLHNLLTTDFALQQNTRLYLISENDGVVISKQEIRLFDKSPSLKTTQLQAFIDELVNNEAWITIIDDFEPGWKVAFQRSTETIFRPLRKFLFQIIVANLALGILLLFFAIFTAQSISRPIRMLAEAAKRISHGHLNEKFPIKGKDEIRELAAEFETMRQKLLESYQNLEKKIEERTRALKEAQFQISHQEKMASIGLLAAGIAHEIGNPLTSISSMTQIIKRKVNDENVKQYLNTILENIERISRIVRELVDFARPSSLEATWVNVNDVVRNAYGIVKYDRRAKTVDFQLNLQENLPNLFLAPDQLLQVILNMLLNAMDALKEGKGKIEITTRLEDDHVIISIADTGVGIPQEHLNKIFEPFFTTKDVGHGTGLGLSVSYGIIKNFNGSIQVKSEVGKGSIFIIKLPVKSNMEQMNES
ncbi:sensor histidine kinase [Caldithrix abyssi]